VSSETTARPGSEADGIRASARSAAARLVAVTKHFGGGGRVGPIDLEFPRGSTTVLLGSSGSGKTTILRFLNGLATADEGHVEVLGERLTAARLTDVRRRIGYVIQEGGLFPHLTVRENATLLARHLERERSAIDARLEELSRLARVDATLFGRLPHELSGGQRQRVALVRALMESPELLLLDEPLGALDPLVRRELREDLRRVVRELGITVVLVTHDLDEAAFFADDVVLLHEGRVVQLGTIDSLERAPADPFVERFFRAQRPRGGA
jgi:osmoprotectant transport system ATP-binding protein